MKFVFFGTDDFSVAVLEELKKVGFIPALVITAPDKPRGRGLALTSPPAKEWSLHNNIPFFQPEKLDHTATIILASKIVDCFVVASYGKIIPKSVLEIPKYGALNVHPSLLPRYRGPSPIESQILADEKDIGVSVMQMDEQMDHGSIVAQKKWEHAHLPKGSELRKKLAQMGGKLLAETIPKWVSGEIKAVLQDESKASYTKKFTKADGEINRAGDGYKNFLKIRALDGTIGTYFFIETTPPSVQKQRPPLAQGRVEGQNRIRVKIVDADLRDGTLRILRVIPEGRREVSYADFLRGVK